MLRGVNSAPPIFEYRGRAPLPGNRNAILHPCERSIRYGSVVLRDRLYRRNLRLPDLPVVHWSDVPRPSADRIRSVPIDLAGADLRGLQLGIALRADHECGS